MSGTIVKKKKIRLLYDISSMVDHIKRRTGTGIFTVSYNILKELARRSSVFDVSLYSSNQNFSLDELKAVEPFMGKLKVFNGDYMNVDVFFSPKEAVPDDIKYQPHIKKYLFLYDLTPFLFRDYFEAGGNDWYFKMFHSLNKNDFYFMDSLSTQRDFISYNHNISGENSAVVPLACDSSFLPKLETLNDVKKKYKIPENKRYVFSLCTLEPRKNLLRAIKTFIQFIDKNSIDDMVFVLGGGSWKTFMTLLEKELVLLGKYRDKILTIGYVADKDLAPLYSGAEWFVYTSQYEGFGLPPLEAMACGCPVITSNNSSLPEVVGDAGVMIDWDNDEQHIKAYEKYYFDKKFREEMAKRGLKRSKLFSWEKAVDVIEEKMVEKMVHEPSGDNIIQKRNSINLLFDANLLIFGNKQSHVRSGVFFVVYNLLRLLVAKNQFNVFLYVADKNLNEVKQFLSTDEYLKNVPVAVEADFGNMDAYFSPHADIPDVILKYGRIRTYKVIHDFMGCIFPDKIFSTKLENHQRSVRCNKLFCISDNTKNDYIKYVPEVDNTKLVVTYEGANERFSHKSNAEIVNLKKKLQIKNKYILSVCNLAPHKNLFTAIDAFIDFIEKNNVKDLVYVLAGSCPDHFQNEFNQKMQSLGKYKNRILTTGYLKDDDLPVLYSGAEWFVFPSLYEGFGLPVLEAMQCGCPVVCSNTSSMPEILGDCGFLVSPKNKDDFVEAFVKLYKSASLRTKLKNKGLQRAKLFSWNNMADKITNCIVDDLKDKNAVLPIVLITDEKYVAPTIVTITSALTNKYANTHYKFYVLGNSLSEASKKLFDDIDCVELINFNNVFDDFERTHNHVSAAALLKFNIADILSKYDKALYIDTDVIIQQDLSELFATDLADKYAAVVKDIGCMLVGRHNDRLELENYFNSGMMLLNLEKMRKEATPTKLMEYKKNDSSKYFMDQDAFNKVFADNVLFVSPEFNYISISWNMFSDDKIASFYNLHDCELNYVKKHAAILHLADKRKPWQYSDACGADLWRSYYYLSSLKNKKIKYLDQKISGHNLAKKASKFVSRLFKCERGKYVRIYSVLGIQFSRYKKYIGKKVLFSRLKNMDFKLSGFSNAEAWGRWSDGFVSTMIFNFKKLKNDLLFNFEVKPFFAKTLSRQLVNIYANDKFVAQWCFEQGKPMPKTELILPKALKTKKGKVFLRFEYENAKSPKELLVNSDSRKLALGFISMEIKPVNAKESKLKKQWKKLVDEIKKHLPKKKAKSVEAVEEIQVVAKEIIALKNTIDALKNTTETLQKELKALRNEQLTTQKMLVNEKTLLQKKRRLK